MRVALLGLGHMGIPIAERLEGAGLVARQGEAGARRGDVPLADPGLAVHEPHLHLAARLVPPRTSTASSKSLICFGIRRNGTDFAFYGTKN